MYYTIDEQIDKIVMFKEQEAERSKYARKNTIKKAHKQLSCFFESVEKSLLDFKNVNKIK